MNAKCVVCKEGTRNAYEILFGKPEGKRPLVKLRDRWQDNIKIYLKGAGHEVVAWFMWLRI